MPRSSAKIIRALIVLAIAQVIGWGTVGFPAVVGRSIAADLGMSISAVFAGNTILYVLTGLWAPFLAKAFTGFGARRVMICGTGLAVPGFVLMAFAQGPVSYFAAWAILGTAGGATLTTAAHIMLNEVAGKGARRAMGALLLMTGLSSSIFWPTTAVLAEALGWRGTCLVYAGLTLLISLPLYVFGLPRRVATQGEVTQSGSQTRNAAPTSPSTFYLLVTAITLNAFVTFGLSTVMIEILKAEGLPPAQAIAFGSALGVIQVGARGLDFLGGRRWDGISTGLIAGIVMTVGLLLLMFGEGTSWAVAAFIFLYGLGSGALAVARATIPLVFYDSAAYARAASHIALPLNLISAVSPPVLAALLTHAGSIAVLVLAISCSCVALALLLALGRRRPQVAVST